MHASLMSVALATLLAGQVRTSPTPTTRLYVRTVPPGAEIKLDGRSVGKSDYLFTVPEGKYKVIIELELDGYQSEQRTVEIRGGRVMRVELKLAPKTDGSAADLQGTSPPEVGRKRHFVRLVIGDDRMTFEGRDVTWEDLPAMLEKIPHRERTVLEIARCTGYVPWQPGDRLSRHEVKAVALAKRFGFEYPSVIGEHPLGSKGSLALPARPLPNRPLPAYAPDPRSIPAYTLDPRPIHEHFPHVLDIRLGKTTFRDGDNITITEIRGTRPKFEIGGRYLARGTYTLESHAHARLCFYRTTRGPTSGDPPEDPRQRMAVSEGSGTFSLEKEIRHEGYLHLVLYPKTGGSGFGDLYFGQTAEDTLIDKSSASDDATDPFGSTAGEPFPVGTPSQRVN